MVQDLPSSQLQIGISSACKVLLQTEVALHFAKRAMLLKKVSGEWVFVANRQLCVIEGQNLPKPMNDIRMHFCSCNFSFESGVVTKAYVSEGSFSRIGPCCDGGLLMGSRVVFGQLAQSSKCWMQNPLRQKQFNHEPIPFSDITRNFSSQGLLITSWPQFGKLFFHSKIFKTIEPHSNKYNKYVSIPKH